MKPASKQFIYLVSLKLILTFSWKWRKITIIFFWKLLLHALVRWCLQMSFKWPYITLTFQTSFKDKRSILTSCTVAQGFPRMTCMLQADGAIYHGQLVVTVVEYMYQPFLCCPFSWTYRPLTSLRCFITHTNLPPPLNVAASPCFNVLKAVRNQERKLCIALICT
jgi:hypothetical protein